MNYSLSKFLSFVLLFLCSLQLQAQEDIRFSNHKYNRFFHNPAYAGSSPFMEAILAYRNQWVGIEGSPETVMVSLQAPINNTNSGLGGMVYTNKFGIQSDIGLLINYAYHLQINHKAKLSMGLQAGFINKQINWTDLTFYDPNPSTPNDEMIPDNDLSTWVPNFGFGFYFHTPEYYLSASIPRLLANNQPSTEGVSNNIDFDSKLLFYYLEAGLKLPIAYKIDFIPSVLYVASHKVSNLLSVNANFKHEIGLSLGIGYRTDKSWAGMLGYQVSKKLNFAYSYEKSFGEFSSQGYTNHEIILNYNISTRKSQVKSPRYF